MGYMVYMRFDILNGNVPPYPLVWVVRSISKFRRIMCGEQIGAFSE